MYSLKLNYLQEGKDLAPFMVHCRTSEATGQTVEISYEISLNAYRFLCYFVTA